MNGETINGNRIGNPGWQSFAGEGDGNPNGKGDGEYDVGRGGMGNRMALTSLMLSVP